jgi:subtilase family serine protease
MKVVLVALIGIYAVRASWFLFSGALSPLTPVAAAVLALCIVTFHRPPDAVGPWLYALLAACAVGAIANGALLFTASPLYANPVNTAFSWVSLGCFVVLAGALIGTAAARV